MFKILATVRTNRILPTIRFYSHYADPGVYAFLNKFNYVGNSGIYWTHPQSSFIIRVTDDYERCYRGNQFIEDNTCWWYFPKKILSLMDSGFNEQDVHDIENELRKWEVIQTAPKNYFEWCVNLSRCYAAFPNVSKKQKIFATKYFVSTFYTDDSIEKLNADRNFNSSADALHNNLKSIFSGNFDQIIDMNKFRGQNNIPDIYIDNAIRAINIQTELIQLAKGLLKPKIYDLFFAGCNDYLRGVVAEKALFHEHILSKTIISEKDGRTARYGSIGFKWVIATSMTDEDTALFLNLQNPVIDLANLIIILENDLGGYIRDKNVEYTPMSFSPSSSTGKSELPSSSTGKSELEAVKSLANRINEAKKVFVYIWENAKPEYTKHYEYLARLLGFLLDLYFVARVRHTNYRYGWIPRLD